MVIFLKYIKTYENPRPLRLWTKSQPVLGGVFGDQQVAPYQIMCLKRLILFLSYRRSLSRTAIREPCIHDRRTYAERRGSRVLARDDKK